MRVYYEEGDAVRGDQLVAEARDIGKPKVIVKTGRHSAQQVVLRENAFCIIRKKLRFLPATH
jgi:hypothetical protein